MRTHVTFYTCHFFEVFWNRRGDSSGERGVTREGLEKKKSQKNSSRTGKDRRPARLRHTASPVDRMGAAGQGTQQAATTPSHPNQGKPMRILPHADIRVAWLLLSSLIGPAGHDCMSCTHAALKQSHLQMYKCSLSL